MTTLVPHPDDHSPLAEKAATKTASHASEGGHWYDKKGNQIAEALKADGKTYTKCTLVHARKLDLGPGVTTIIKCEDKPGLTLWLRRQSIMAALTLPRRIDETEADWMARVEEDMDRQSREAAEAGSTIHAAIQSAVQGQPWDRSMSPYVDAAMRVLPRDGGKWHAEHGVAHPFGFGTKIDLVNEVYVLDFKTKDGDQAELDAMKLYDDHDMQVAAGQACVIEGFEPASGSIHHNPSASTGGIVFVSRTHPGAAALKLIPEDRMMRGWSMFQHLLHFWQEKTGHRAFGKEF